MRIDGSNISGSTIVSDNVNQLGLGVTRSDGTKYFLHGREDGALGFEKYSNGTWYSLFEAASFDLLGKGKISIQSETQNAKDFSFSNLPSINTNHYKYYLLACGDPTSGGNYALAIGGFTTSNTETHKFIFGNESTFAYTVSVANGVVTFSFTNTRYGGIRLFWLG